MVKLGTYLLCGLGPEPNHEEGLRWLRRAGATNASQLLELAFICIKVSLHDDKARVGLLKKLVFFPRGASPRQRIASLNLAYLVRPVKSLIRRVHHLMNYFRSI